MTKLLLIDDEEAILRVLSMSLKMDGYDVVTAGSGEEGLSRFSEYCPDIVLTDIKMPGMNGIEVLQKIKERDTDAEVIIITGHGDIENAIESLKYGASDFINKPVRDEALAVALDRALEKLKIKRKLAAYTNNLEKEVKAATRELRRNSDFLEKLVKSASNAIVATDRDFNVVIFNPEAERLLGISRQKALGGMNAADLFPDKLMSAVTGEDNGRDPDRILPWREAVITAKGDTKKAKTEIPVRFTGTLLYEKEKVTGSVFFLLDLRDIKRLEKELVKSERLAAIGQTVAGLAHGIKNILHGFKGGSYLVNIGINKKNDEKLRAGWDMIQRNITRTSELVLDLLAYSKEREPEFELCRPNDIINDVCDLLLDTARENDIEIRRVLDPEVGKVMMDPRTVHGALLNLAGNAIDACLFDDGIGKKWRVTIKSRHDDTGAVYFDVTDNGAGMSEDVKSKIFASFFSTKGHRGTGLGLLVTRKMVKEHNGDISVESELGQGTRFIIRLPYKPA